ncbi:TPA: hypothetical protein REG82_002893 [Listeria monocytogenes]|uniref:hypothetical protein n=1 Tax=Listeria monocytogenes TaxID=1639 RepID=UPI00175FBCBA|nr:hypothetical protein [Listeria monocytogenes]HAM2149107.1 hypothetical protein [Listeria monocytogenes]HDT8790325.1 hypothetical protein [Listeria monocytogenes]HDT9734545.1 hypothetical protein [Listeria monocytogenes]HDU0466535.1 hypothetical protein [Listeria monocytogenes]
MIKRIKDLNHLKSIHTNDKRKYKMGEKAFACTTNPLFFIAKNGEKVVTNEWFVNSTKNELIFDIKRNRWVNMEMYEDGISTVTDDIYYFENDNEVSE